MENERYIIHSSNGSHKYIDRYRGKNGKWVYVYKKAVSKLKPTVESGGYNDGERDRQSWTSVETKNGTGITALKGSNSENKYAGVMIGKPKEDYKFIEKSKKIGGVEFNYDNENGTHNITVHVDHATIEKGKSVINKLLKKK